MSYTHQQQPPSPHHYDPQQQQQQQQYAQSPQYASAHTLAQLAKALLLANAAISAASLFLQLLFLAGVGQSGLEGFEETINPVELLQGLVGLAQVAVYIATVVAFLMWLHRSYKNLTAFGKWRDQSPGWVVGSWFIPILNLFRPYQNVKELWIKSDPGADFSGGFAADTPVARGTGLLGIWWGFWLASNFAGRAYSRLAWRAETSDQMNFAATAGVFAALFTLVAAVLAFLVVSAIDRMQEEKAARLSVNAWPAPPPPPASFEAPPAQP